MLPNLSRDVVSRKGYTGLREAELETDVFDSVAEIFISKPNLVISILIKNVGEK